jgi:hypothetical protein
MDKFNENPSTENRIVPCGWTDRHDEANGHILQYANASKTLTMGVEKNHSRDQKVGLKVADESKADCCLINRVYNTKN